MGATLAEKIIARAAGRPRVVPDEIVWANVDVAMIQDSGGPRRLAPALGRLGARVWDPERLVVVSDHYVPAADIAAAEILSFTRKWAAANGISRFHEGEGISHTLMVEKGYAQPGMLYAGGDSHSCHAGVLGCLALGFGSTDMLGVLVTGRVWLRVPATIRVELDGRLPVGLTAKDVILSLIGEHGMDGALYRVLEFGGSGLLNLSVGERSVLTNMCAEIGAKTGIIPADGVTLEFLRESGVKVAEDPPQSDPDASFVENWTRDLSKLEPMVACPHTVDNVVPMSSIGSIAITRAYVGACTGAKYEDLRMIAEVLRGRKVADGVRLLVAPASRRALQAAIADGTLETIMDAGADLMAIGCGACPGLGNGVLGPGDVCISTTNRNFRGRMGSPDASVYLASPYAVAASAVAGRIADPREVLGRG